MKERMLGWKASIVLFFSGFAEVLGWKGVLIVMLVCSMALDYASGTVAAMKAGKWKSKKAREGLMHKSGMILVGLVAGMFDLVVWVVCNNMDFGIHWPGVALPMVCCWYFFTECGSILENCEKMGANVPGWMPKLMKASLTKVIKAIWKAFGTETEPEEPDEE